MFYEFLFVVSTFIIALSRNLPLLVIWIFMWIYSAYFSTKTNGHAFLIFILGFMLFYPITLDINKNISDSASIIFLIISAFIVKNNVKVFQSLKEFPKTKILIYGWIVWGLVEYIALILVNYFGMSYTDSSEHFLNLKRESTMFLTVGPTISSVFIIVICLFAIRTTRDLEFFFKALFKGTLILLILSLVRYFFDFDYYQQSYGSVRSMGFRLTGFGVVDANGYGRLLLMPIIFLTIYAIKFPKLLSTTNWITLVLGIISIIMTFSRGTYIAFTIALIMITLPNIFNMKSYLFIILAAIIIAYVFQFTSLMDYFYPGSDRMSLDNFYSRVILWQGAFNILYLSPWFGLHPGGWATLLHNAPQFAGEAVQSTHNVFLGVAVDWGLPMAIILFIVFISTMYNAWITMDIIKKSYNSIVPIKLAANGLLIIPVALMIFGSADNIPVYYIFLIYGLSLALLRLTRSLTENPTN